MNNIIAAIATPQGEGGISIIRLSGENVIEVANKFTTIDLTKKASNTINYGEITDINGNRLDEALISVMRAPHTFTGDETIEINCHGGIYVTNNILENLLLDDEIDLAEPGEFTKRAFLNGKKTLIEAESLMDIIQANSDQSHQMALNSLHGTTQNLIVELREELLLIITQMEVNIDYPEYEDIEEVTNKMIKDKIEDLLVKINEIIIDSKKGELIKDGITTAIIGAPNVGKSSLLNALSRSNKAIVTDIAGTTRDVIESQINLGGIKLNLIDTAGIRDTDNIVEKLGVEKSKDLIEEAELILYILDASRDLNEEEKELLDLIDDKRHIKIINKVDISKNNIESLYVDAIKISTLQSRGLEHLEIQIVKEFDLGSFDVMKSNYVTNTRHITKLEKTKMYLETVNLNLDMKMPMDMVEIDLKEAMFMLGEILGIEVKNDLLNELFSRFCLGK